MLYIIMMVAAVTCSQQVKQILSDIRELDLQIEALEAQMGYGGTDFDDDGQDEVFDDKSHFLGGVKLVMDMNFNNSKLSEAQTLHLRQLRYPHTFLLVAIEDSTSLVVINMRGRIISKWEAQSEIVLYSLNQFSDEIVIGVIDTINQAYTVILKQQELNTVDNITEVVDQREVDKDGFFDVFALEEEAKFEIPDHLLGGAQINALIVNQARNSKVFLLGDSKGSVVSLWQNGTMRGKTIVSREPIIAFMRRNPHIMYSTPKQFGFINGVTLQVALPLCEKPAEPIILLFQENQYAQNIYALQKNMEIVVYQIKQGKQSECTINHKIHSYNILEYRGSNKYQMALINGYLGLFSTNSHHFNIFNTTSYKQRSYTQEALLLHGVQDDLLVQANRLRRFEVHSIKKSSSQSLIYQLTQTRSGTKIQMLELTHVPVYVSPFTFSFMESFRFPMILVAIFIVFMFQYFSRKKGDDNDVDEDRLTQLTKRKVDEMVRQYQSANLKDEPQE